MNIARCLSTLPLFLFASGILCAQPPGRGDRGSGEMARGDSSRGDGKRSRDDGRGGRGGPSHRGNSSGNFSANSFLSRLDTNGNGMLDVSEQAGSAGFIIRRVQEFDSSIQVGQPIPLKKIEDAFNKMRGARDRGADPSPRPSGRPVDDALIPELLVKGFGSKTDPVPLLGFGATAEMLSVVVTQEDEREAAERIRRFDRDKNGYLSGQELGRFSGNPLDFDRNRDGKLSASELAVRSARRREGEEEARQSQVSKPKSNRRAREQRDETLDVYNGRRSYRENPGRRTPDGLPGFFSDRDANGDGQITMAEYADEFNESVIAEFLQSDLNNDGVIVPAEALRAIEQGDTTPAVGTTSMPRSPHPTSPQNTTSGNTLPRSTKSARVTRPDEKFVKVAERIVKRYDKNGNSELTPSEWKKMLMSPAAADTNRDGKITIHEYATWMNSRGN